MKRIVKLSGSDTKLRLRGQGSGFLEGVNKQESEEPLHLCVSCKEYEGYQVAVKLVSELLEEIYGEYRALMDKGLVPKRDNLKVVCVEQPLMYHNGGQPASYEQLPESNGILLSEEEIQRLIEARNAARARLNFEDADRIRDVLRAAGIGLMDEPGGRGRGTEVTTWRYWR